MCDDHDAEPMSGLEVLRAYRPHTTDRRLGVFRAVDPQFATTWEQHVSRLLRRPQLQPRKRYLLMAGQQTMLENLEALEEVLDAACIADIDPREMLEAILQCYTYAGETVVERAVSAFLSVITRRGLLDRVQAGQPRSDVTRQGRSVEEERLSWAAEEREDSRAGHFLDRYGWPGVSSGLRLRPGHFINVLTTLEALDPEFLQIWVDTVYEGMYMRRVLDDATRIMIVYGNCLAVGQTHQGRRHLRGALRQGAEPTELLEVIIQTTATIGHPNLMPSAFDDWIMIMEDEGKLTDVVEPERIDELVRISRERMSRRAGIQEMPTSI